MDIFSIIAIQIPFFVAVTRTVLKRYGKMPDTREALNRSVRERRIESGHSIKSLQGMGSRSSDFGTNIGIYSFTVDCETSYSEDNVALVV